MSDNQSIQLKIDVLADARAGVDAFVAMKKGVAGTQDKLQKATRRVRDLVESARAGKLQMLEEAQKKADSVALGLTLAQGRVNALKEAAREGKLGLLQSASHDLDAANAKLRESQRQLEYFRRQADLGGAAVSSSSARTV